MLSGPLFFLALFACLLVLAVLVVGIVGFSRGGEFNRKYANKIMRLRILMQFIAVLVILGVIYLSSGGG